jgi:predicted AlkP superfamily phosphohydrolase/phosphomutase
MKVVQLIKNLKELLDYKTQQPIFEKVYTKKELYNGDYLEHAPDIILKMKDYSINILRGYPIKGKIIKKIDSPEGCHDPNGIFAVYGNDIVSGKKINASIMDVTPTVLYNMGLSVHKDMDGVVQQQIFKAYYKENRDITYLDHPIIDEKRDVRKKSYTKSEKEDVANKLRDLGYFD